MDSETQLDEHASTEEFKAEGRVLQALGEAAPREQVLDLDLRLRRVLSDIDPFWVRWSAFIDGEGGGRVGPSWRSLVQEAQVMKTLPRQSEWCERQVALLLKTMPSDGRKVSMRETRGGWTYQGLTGTCERLSADSVWMVMTVERDPEDYWQSVQLLLVELGDESVPVFLEDLS